MDKFYWDSFKTFFRIGAFTIGGGYAMIPLIESEVVDKHRWLSRKEFLDIIAIAQSCPGVFAINMSVVIILLIAMFFANFQDNPVVEAIFRGVRPAVVALIAAPTFSLARSAKISLANCWIPIAGALAIWLMHVNPVVVILAAGVGGYMYGKLVKPTEK